MADKPARTVPSRVPLSSRTKTRGGFSRVVDGERDDDGGGMHGRSEARPIRPDHDEEAEKTAPAEDDEEHAIAPVDRAGAASVSHTTAGSR